MNNPIVSVVVTTRNNHRTLDQCLSSIINQTYKPLELIVVDRDSTDGTKDIARFYTDLVFNCGPERSAQRNFAVARASGEYVAIIDSDMELSPHVIQDCVDTMQYKPQTTGIIIPEESFGRGFWAQCKRLERSFYNGNDAIEAARFFTKDVYEHVGGYDQTMVSGEDWDLSARVRNLGRIERITSIIRHNEGDCRLIPLLRKKYYYAGQARAYLAKNNVGAKLTANAGPIQRYKMFLSKPRKLFSNPFTGTGMLFMKTCEFLFGAFGYVFSGRRQRV
ncbi:MAG TPA: glycosyltransferase [Nevskiaceae bacterium]|nr:glycosyltransferase [Nevskiaceae bacterium]